MPFEQTLHKTLHGRHLRKKRRPIRRPAPISQSCIGAVAKRKKLCKMLDGPDKTTYSVAAAAFCANLLGLDRRRLP